MTITLRPQRTADARRFYEILKNDHFTYLQTSVKSEEEEEEWLRKNEERREQHKEYNYTILSDEEIVGGCGIKIDQHRPYIGEIGYFVDERHWGRGIASEAVKELERIGFEQLGITRMIILTHPENRASERVAIKCGYRREGLLHKAISASVGGEKHDCWLYAKLKEDYRESQAASSLSKS